MRKILVAILLLTSIVIACKKDDPAPPQSSTPCTTNQFPSDGGSVTPGAQVTLAWNGVNGATSYDVYLGTSNAPTTLVGSNVTNTNLIYTVPNTTGVIYYWYVVPKSANGTATGCTSKVTSFKASVGSQAPAGFGYYVVGYFPNYRALTDIPDVKFRMCNVVNYAFFSVNSSGTLTVNNASLVPQFITKAKTNNARPFLSINEVATGNFKSMASTAAGRTAFIVDVMNKVRQYGFEGVDIDWEYPSLGDGTSVTFTALMKELADSLHMDAKYYLTAAITPGRYAGNIRDGITNEVFNYADWFNIMVYDDFSNTVPYKHHSDYALAVYCLNYWLNTRGMPPSKCVLGFPAYGRGSGVSGTTNLGSQSTAYRTIIAQGGDPMKDSAVITQASLTFTTYYNGQSTVKKKAILAKQIANGVMMWEKWHDTHDGTSLLKAACDTVGRSY
jgi:chitinase